MVSLHAVNALTYSRTWFRVRIRRLHESAVAVDATAPVGTRIAAGVWYYLLYPLVAIPRALLSGLTDLFLGIAVIVVFLIDTALAWGAWVLLGPIGGVAVGLFVLWLSWPVFRGPTSGPQQD